MSVFVEIRHSPDESLSRCAECLLRREAWDERPYCLARTTHSDAKIYGDAKAARCASCGLEEDSWPLKPLCPTSRWNPDFKPVRF